MFPAFCDRPIFVEDSDRETSSALWGLSVNTLHRRIVSELVQSPTGTVECMTKYVHLWKHRSWPHNKKENRNCLHSAQ